MRLYLQEKYNSDDWMLFCKYGLLEINGITFNIQENENDLFSS